MKLELSSEWAGWWIKDFNSAGTPTIYSYSSTQVNTTKCLFRNQRFGEDSPISKLCILNIYFSSVGEIFICKIKKQTKNHCVLKIVFSEDRNLAYFAFIKSKQTYT